MPHAEAWRDLRRLLAGHDPGRPPHELAEVATAGEVVVLAAALDPALGHAAEQPLARALYIHMHVEQAALRVAEVLQRACRAVLLKGNATARLVYERPEHRQTLDVDVLVSAEDFEAALAALRADGWEDAVGPGFAEVEGPDPYEWALSRSFGRVRVACDVHQRLTWGRRFSVEHAGILARARTVDGAPLPICHPEDALLHTCLHAAANDFRTPLKAWVDVARLVAHTDVDLEGCAERAAEWRCATSLWSGLLIARSWLEAPVPDGVLRRLRPHPARAAALNRLLSGQGATPVRERLAGRLREAAFGPLVGDDLRASGRWAFERARQVVRHRLPSR